ncbi:HslU--HslV peptidase ATPase subunit [Campylobacter corcagiensis]|uniref:HslU--HslV peptidase ATPase subunit n=1 Tax=Campylobacter corcagiensis TaxID=1448857 RepID=A0A7M1LIA5_9BACT|nr:HslU--HslV peptidase ATPase subunit [Campylobacter corcagiensis]QKF64602.1 heat shock protein HslVU, ATPase subunit [Campylobacter corcagiensis]QOQ87225.1 HslU--HslV peptidase ATPase subunit [Campylobacter corcagiensis]
MLTPRQIVAKLDEYVIGQSEAKKVIAVALRNRYRRMKLDDDIKDEVIPKNILMIGSTGVGKTEIARRLSKLFGLPFVKVEASKYTEVGFVGRDVESMVRDLAVAALNLVKNEEIEKSSEKIDFEVEKIILEKLLPPLPKGASDEKLSDYEKSFEKMRQRLKSGALDDLNIDIEVNQNMLDTNPNLPPEMQNMQESFVKIIGVANKKVKKNLKVKDAKTVLRSEASEKILDMEAIKTEAMRRARDEGIIFIDEIDKVAVGNGARQGDPSKEGVQRDLLPIVEGSSVATKYGTLDTDHILFIAAGAFHMSKPSDLIPELQGRFPLRVELDSLDENALFEILTKPKNSLLKQYTALLKTENVNLEFSQDGIKEISKIAANTNENIEDIGARRLHTVLEKVMEDISYEADSYSGQTVKIDADYVKQKVGEISKDVDLARYIL